MRARLGAAADLHFVRPHTNTRMKQAIEQALAPLVGLQLWAMGRAGSLEWFQFGGLELVPDRAGNSREVGSYALRVAAARSRWDDVGI